MPSSIMFNSIYCNPNPYGFQYAEDRIFFWPMFNTVRLQLVTDLLSVGFDQCLHSTKLNYMSTQLSKLLLLV